MRASSVCVILALAACLCEIVNARVYLDRLRVQKGFKIEIFADNMTKPRSMATTPAGTTFVGTFGFLNISGETDEKTPVYALIDRDGDGILDKPPVKITEDIWIPNAVTFLKGDLYIARIGALYRIPNIEERLFKDEKTPFATEVITTTPALPEHKWHGWRYMTTDGESLFIAIGAPCNVPGDEDPRCLDDPIFGSIYRINVTTGDMTHIAQGIRNSVGMTFHPVTGDLWFTDNGRDWMQKDHTDIPPEEINVMPKSQIASVPVPHYGFPYCYGKGLQDPEFPHRPCSNFIPSTHDLPAHAAALGLRFYTGSQFPKAYRHDLLVAEHGSWNRQPPSGYDVVHVPMDAKTGIPEAHHVPFVTGWLSSTPKQCNTSADCDEGIPCQNDPSREYEAPFFCGAWGRPVDVAVHVDGSVLISDEKAGVVYRVSYAPEAWYKDAAAIIAIVLLSLSTLIIIAGSLLRKMKSASVASPTSPTYSRLAENERLVGEEKQVVNRDASP